VSYAPNGYAGTKRTRAGGLELAGGLEVIDTAPDHFDEVLTHYVIR
jgi:hypothetical protein